jgi:hypothetical protein
MTASRKEGKCSVCGNTQSVNWDIPRTDPPKCHKCGHYLHPKMYGGGGMYR